MFNSKPSPKTIMNTNPKNYAYLRPSIFPTIFLMVINVFLISLFITSCKKDILEQKKNENNLPVTSRSTSLNFIQDSLAAHPTTLAYIAELGTLNYEIASVSEGPLQFLWAQIPIIAAGSNTINNLLEVLRLPDGVCQFKIHSKTAYAVRSLSPQFAFATDNFKSMLNRFETLERQNGLQSILDRLYEVIYIQLENGQIIMYDPETGNVYYQGGGGNLNGWVDPTNGTFHPYVGCLYNWTTMNVVNIWSTSHPLNPILSSPEGGFGWHFLGQSSFSFGFNLTFPSGSWGYGSLTSGGTGNDPNSAQTNVQYEDIKILQKAQTRIKATYGLDLDINTLVQLFGIDCILQLGNRVLPAGQYYSESDCVEAVLEDTPIICLMSDVTTFKNKYHVEPPVDAALKCYTAFPGCGAYNAYEECVLNSILTSKYNENYLSTAQYQANLDLIRNAIISGAISIETGQKIFDATLGFGAIPSQTSFLINLAQQNSGIDFYTILVTNFGFTTPPAQPTNLPISTTKLACSLLFKFITVNDPTPPPPNSPPQNPPFQVAVACLSNIYFSFNYNNMPKLTEVNAMGFEIYRKNGGPSCIGLSDNLAAQIINTTVSMTQTDVNGLSLGMSDSDLQDFIRNRIRWNLPLANAQVMDFNGCQRYSSNAALYPYPLTFETRWSGLTSTNCDANMKDCN